MTDREGVSTPFPPLTNSEIIQCQVVDAQKQQIACQAMLVADQVLGDKASVEGNNFKFSRDKDGTCINDVKTGNLLAHMTPTGQVTTNMSNEQMPKMQALGNALKAPQAQVAQAKPKPKAVEAGR